MWIGIGDFFREHPTANKQQLLDKATELDDTYGNQFNPSR
jgi:hypothetical protein